MKRAFFFTFKVAAQTPLCLVPGYLGFWAFGLDSPLLREPVKFGLATFLATFISVATALLIDWFFERPTEWSLHEGHIRIRTRWSPQGMTVGLDEIETLKYAEDMLRLHIRQGPTLKWRYLRPHQHKVAADIEQAWRSRAMA